MSKLTAAQRKEIIADYEQGRLHDEYKVVKTPSGRYQVRKRLMQSKHDDEELHNDKPDNDKDSTPRDKKSPRLSNTQLLTKLAKLLELNEDQADDEDDVPSEPDTNPLPDVQISLDETKAPIMPPMEQPPIPQQPRFERPTLRLR